MEELRNDAIEQLRLRTRIDVRWFLLALVPFMIIDHPCLPSRNR